MTTKNAWVCCAFCAVGFVVYCSQVYARSNSNEVGTLQQCQNPNVRGQNVAVEQNSSDKDHSGQNDFDFEMGIWKICLRRLLHPLTGSTTWVKFDGSSITREVWDGGAQLEQFETDRPAAGHIEGLTLRLYNPQFHQWSLYWANGQGGPIFPPQIGEFKNGRGEFFGRDTLNGKAILIRFVWSDTTTNLAPL
jgi:hypothetical protein